MSGDALYDLKGLKCPLPVIRTEKRLSSMRPGEQIAVATTDPLASIDIPHFCNESGNRLVSHTRLESGDLFVIERSNA